MIIGSVKQEDIMFVNIYAQKKKNIYAHNIGTPKYIKQILTDLKKEIESNTIVVGDLSMDRSLRQKINKETLAITKILDQRDSTDTCRTFQSKTRECTFFSVCTERFPG